MSSLYPNPHQEGCPWFDWAETFGASAFHYCEPTVCALVSEPANTYSNIAYFLAAGFVLSRVGSSPGAWHLRFYGWSLALIGVCSTLYHAANIWPLHFFDFFGMYVSILFVAALGLVKNNFLGRRQFWPFYFCSLAVFCALTICFYYLGVNFRYNVGFIALSILGLETFYRFGRSRPGNYPAFLGGMAAIGIGNVLSSLDLHRVWCNASAQWLFGHSIWHLLSAFGLGLALLHWQKAYPEGSLDGPKT